MPAPTPTMSVTSSAVVKQSEPSSGRAAPADSATMSPAESRMTTTASRTFSSVANTTR